jgi:hypothetical protein
VLIPRLRGKTGGTHPFAIAATRVRGVSSRLNEEGERMELNWAAIGVAGIADWLLGAVWFTVFSKQWQAGLRMPPEEMQSYMSHPNFWPYIVSFLCSVLIAYTIARLVGSSLKHGVFRGITVGLLVGLAAAVAMITEMVFEARMQSFILISAAYPLIGCVLMGIIVGAWRRKPTSV